MRSKTSLVVPPVDLEINILKMAGDSDLVTMELLEEMCTWESSGHVTDDSSVTWPLDSQRRWRHLTLKGQGRDHNMLRVQNLGIGWIATYWWQRSAFRKWLRGKQMVTWPMMSRDPERSISLGPNISETAGDRDLMTMPLSLSLFEILAS